MMLLAAATNTPVTHAWSPTIAIVMILSNIVAIAIGKFSIQHPNAGPQLPSSNLFGGFGLPAVLATTSFGHILGAGVILGLSSLGVI
ncbi:Photosystem I reaction center subunit PsaK [Planktothrix tepida]|uniref:Photosystem I reaction center subunit PsaK n=2 Tax=Planktothrix TaxID=54304 RepID=A0A1J1LRR4_9CYAN|nr:MULTISPECIES: photosystem I reaction center subunit PsaK [Planktothrix]CAD5941165.1 Photosystem I reaction center subunit PsaK [Planktothrix pseudagardhii]CAD5969726.1 Photosystem I reaction center subunit PsaK [Planktothrix tepida]CUR35277.1 Photosystem I reaction center subunit PsaK [Planktothrix tepida PCC 9214]